MLVLAAAAVSILGAPLQSEEFFSDGINFVYRERQSCAWYVDFPGDVMLRLSYRHSSGETFFSVVGGPWNVTRVGERYTVAVGSDLTGRTRQAFSVMGIIQPGEDNRRGISGDQQAELLNVFRGANRISIAAERIGDEVYGLTDTETALDKLVSCSMAYF